MDPITTDPPPPMPTDHFPTPSLPATTHPPYSEMITAAIIALKDKAGSSRQAISKFIEQKFTNLPPTHSTLLTHHLKRLKNLGQLVMVKHSYMLPTGSGQLLDFTGSGNVSEANFVDGSFSLENSGSGSVLGSKRKPGRPPKLKPVPGLGVNNNNNKVQNVEGSNNADVAAYQPQFEYHGSGGGFGSGSGSGFQGGGGSAGGSEPLFASLGLGNDGAVVEPVSSFKNVDATPVVVKRGRGRPPKSAGGSGGQLVVSGGKVAGSGAGGGGGGGEVQGVKARPGRPGRKGNVVRVKRGRGRPKRVGFGAVTVPLSGNLLRPRGRPKRVVRQKVTAVNGGAGESVLGSRRRGRPSRKMNADSIGKSFGSLSKGGLGTAVIVTDPEKLVVYQELKSKYVHLQTKVKQVSSMVKSCIDPDYGNTALSALQELEDLAAEVNRGARGQTHGTAPSS